MNKLKRCRYGTMVYPANDLYIGRSLELYGEFSEGEVALFRRIVKPGDTVLDIGANIGAHTIPLAQLAGRTGRVVAFEPQRFLYYCLCGNVVVNNLGNVDCRQAAAGAAAGLLAVPELDYDAEHNFGGLDLRHEYTGLATYNVPVTPVDDLGLQRCNLIKIDVEGMEKDVLQGATGTIRQFKPILYVEDDRPDKSAELRKLIRDLDYVVYQHRPPYFNPANLANNQQNVFPNLASFNLFCHPRGATAPVNPDEFRMARVDQ
jgi:FkbM family methyltransferase